MHNPSDPSPLLDRHMLVRKEQAWIAGLRQGDMEVFQVIFETFAHDLWRVASVSVPSDIAEDIVQDVMFDLWTRRETVEIRDGFAPYLFTATRYRVSKHLRHDGVVQRSEREGEAGHPPGMGTAPLAPDSSALAGDLNTALMVAFGRLSEIQRLVVTLRWTHEMPYEQIASTLSISVAAAKQHGSRAQRILRPYLERYFERDR